MSVWKKIAGLLFEETETEIVAEDELEPIEIHKKAKSTPVKEEREPVYQMYEPSTPIQEKTSAVKEEKRFVPIDLEDEPKKQEAPAVSKAEVPLRMKQSVREEKKEFEFTPVISPIFGSSEEPIKPKKKPATVRASKPKKKNPLGTIISPYYGMEELEEFEQEAHQKIERDQQLREEELPQEEMQKLDVKEEINSLPLEDLIEHGECEGAQEDLLQISLFGESTPIQKVEEAEKSKEV